MGFGVSRVLCLFFAVSSTQKLRTIANKPLRALSKRQMRVAEDEAGPGANPKEHL